MSVRERLKAGGAYAARAVRMAATSRPQDDRAQMNFLSNIAGSAVDSISGKPEGSQMGSEYVLEEQNFDNTFGSNLTAGSWVDAAEFIVPAQTRYNVGYGSADKSATVGRWYANFEDGSSNAVVGQARIVTRNANDKAVETDISAVATSRLDTNQSDPRTQYAVPEILDTNKVGEDSKVVLQFKLDSGSTGTSIDFSASTFQLSLTEY
jgi:hypothetical protein